MTAAEKQPTKNDPYKLAGEIADMQISAMQQMGTLPRSSEIVDEDAADEYFDVLMRVYMQVCGELGLGWPPPSQDF